MSNTDSKLLTPEQVADALSKGIGRAFDLINAHNHYRYRGYILNACVRNVAYDPLNEEDRAQWLYKLLQHIDGIEFYKDDILDALKQSADPQDKRQLLRLVAKLAGSDTDAFCALFEQLADQVPLRGGRILATLLLGLAQRDGLVDVEQAIDDYLLAHAQNPHPATVRFSSEFLGLICQEMDASEVVRVVLAWLEQCPGIFAEQSVDGEWMIESADAFEDEREVEASGLETSGLEVISPALMDLRSYIDDEMLHDPALFGAWGKSVASEQDLETAFEWFLQERRPDAQTRYLWIFQDKPLPYADFKVLSLAMMADCAELQRAAIQALSTIKDVAIRGVALNLLKTFPDEAAYDAVRLLIQNYQSEDAFYIERVTLQPQQRDRCHALCKDILALCEKWDEPELTGLLLWAYENTPSSATRFDIVRLLHDRARAPRWLFEEACHDCDSGTRMFAGSALAMSID